MIEKGEQLIEESTVQLIRFVLEKGSLLSFKSIKAIFDLICKGVKGVYNKNSLKALNQLGATEHVEVKDEMVKTVKRELKKQGIQFQIRKGVEGNHEFYFVAKDAHHLEIAMKRVYKKLGLTVDSPEVAKKPSVEKQISNAKEKVGKQVTKSAEKFKQQGAR